MERLGSSEICLWRSYLLREKGGSYVRFRHMISYHNSHSDLVGVPMGALDCLEQSEGPLPFNPKCELWQEYTSVPPIIQWRPRPKTSACVSEHHLKCNIAHSLITAETGVLLICSAVFWHKMLGSVPLRTVENNLVLFMSMMTRLSMQIRINGGT